MGLSIQGLGGALAVVNYRYLGKVGGWGLVVLTLF